MKTLLLPFVCLFFMAQISFAQHDFSSPEITPENYKDVTIDIEALPVPEPLLDSIVTTSVNSPDPFTSRKSLYTYYEDGQRKSTEHWTFDEANNSLYIRNIYTYSYEGDNIIHEIWMWAEDANSPLQNQYRFKKTFNEDGYITELIQDRWNQDIEEWEGWYKRTVVENTGDFLKTNVYFWNTTDNEYVLNSWSEQVTSGLESTTTIYSPNVFGEFEATNISYLRRNEYNNYIEEWSSSVFLFSLNEWETFYSLNIDYDNDDKRAVRTISRVETIGQLDDLVIVETENIGYNEDWIRQYDTLYLLDDMAEFQLTSRQEYDYRPDNLSKQIRKFNAIGNEFEPFDITNFYYSDEPNAVSEIDETPFPYQLIYPNPATGNDHIQIQGEYSPGQQKLDLRITDQQGKIISSQLVNINESVSLGGKQLSAGMYYLTLSGEEGRKTWKVVLE